MKKLHDFWWSGFRGELAYKESIKVNRHYLTKDSRGGNSYRGIGMACLVGCSVI